MQNVIVMYTRWPCSLVSYNKKAMCAQSQGGLEGRNDTQGKEWGRRAGGRLQRNRARKRKKIADRTLFAPHLWSLATPTPHLPQFQVTADGLPTNLGVCFWGSCCEWWQCWRSPPPPRLLSPPGPHWRTWRWRWNSSRRSAHVSLCLQRLWGSLAA